MATRKAIRPMQRLGLNTTPGMNPYEEASLTCVKGALLRFNGAGYVEECDSTVLGLIGVADEAGHNGTAGQYRIGMAPADPSIIFEASVDTSADEDTGESAQAQVGVQYGLTKDAAGIWYVDLNKTEPDDVRCVVEGLKDPAGTLLGRVKIRFLI